jgi:hypothetical protein
MERTSSCADHSSEDHIDSETPRLTNEVDSNTRRAI